MKIHKVFAALCAVLFFMIFSCEPREVSDPHEGIPVPERAEEPVKARQAELFRGNSRKTGIPGFGGNAFPVLFGEYRVEAPADFPEGEDAYFSVWISREPLFFDPLWGIHRGIGSFEAYERRENDDLLLAIILEDEIQGCWTAVVEYKPALEKALGETLINRLSALWSERLMYFLALAKTPEDLSLPAIVSF